MLLKWLFLFIALVSSPCLVTAQDYPMRHFRIEDGLTSNTVYYIYRDSKGFIWATTDKGVVRYNGIRFEKFTTSNGLADNENFAVQEDKEGRLWFASYNGALCYFKNDSFHTAANTPFLKQQGKHEFIKKIIALDDGSIVFLYYESNYFCYINKDTCRAFTLNNIINRQQNDWTLSINKTHPGRFDVMSTKTKVAIEISTGHILSIHHQLAKINNDTLYDLNINQDQKYLVGLRHLHGYNQNSIKAIPSGFSVEYSLNHVYKSNDDNLIFATSEGLFIDNGIHILDHENITSITQDVAGNYWVSTLHNGIYSFSRNFASSGFYSRIYSGDKISYAKEVNGRLFFCTTNDRLSVLEKGYRKLLLNLDEIRKDKYDKGSSTMAFLDAGNRLYYFDTKLNCLLVENVLSGSPQIKKYTTTRLPQHSPKKVIKVQDKLYLHLSLSLVATNLNEFSGSKRAYTYNIVSERRGRIFAMASAPDNTVWYSTISNLLQASGQPPSPKAEKYKNFAFKNFDFIGEYLVGCTHNNQLLICRDSGNSMRVDTIIQDYVWDNLYKLDDVHILITTSGPCYLLTLSEKERAGYLISAIESPFIPIQPEAVCVGASHCYFFKNGDIITYSKQELLKSAPAPVVYFTHLTAAGKSYQIGNTIDIPFRSRGNISISFATVSFGGSDVTCQYSVSKDGVDNWINFNGNINLANPSFGSYVIKVRSKTISSPYSKPVMFTLNILRPFWATLWFISLAVALATALVYIIIRKRIKTTLIKKEKEHSAYVRFIKSEYKAMNALMNPHFIFNALNNVQSLVNNDDKMNATEYLGIFADLVRQNMHNISRETISLQKEMDLVENYLLLEQLRFEKQLNYTIDISEDVDLSDILIPPLLIQPLVENAIKHGILPLKSKGKQGYLHISIHEKAETLYIRIKDNGPGIAQTKEKAQLHESYGLENIRNRIKQLSIIQDKEISFDITEESGTGDKEQWTVATISLPVF